jgi:subtilisin-like proprotein convertase family protein
MNRHTHRTCWIALLALLVSLCGPGLPAALADDGPPPPPDDAPSVPAAPAASTPTACAAQVATASSHTPQPINDFSTITSSVTVSTTFNFVWSIRVVTVLTHTANGNLDLTLVSPAGTRVLLAANQGGSNDNVFAGTNWRDTDDAPVTDFAFANNVTATQLSPQEPLGALRGEDANGDWKLVIHDGTAGDQGMLQSWFVQVTGLNHAPDVTSSATFTSTGSFPIPDFGVLAVAPLTVPALPDPITALSVSTVLTHARPGTLVAFLVAPSNSFTVTLSSSNGLTATNAFAGTLWDDRAARADPLALVTTHHYTAGQLASPLAPEEPLSALLNTSATGTWQLKVIDVTSDGQSGVIGPVVLHVQTGHCFPNLSVDLNNRPGFPRVGQSAALIFGAANTSLTATSISLTATLNPQMRFQSVQTGSWSCSAPPVNTAGGDIHCTRASLGAHQEEVITATITAPSLPGEAPFTATVSSSLPDTDPTNNTLVRLLTTYVQSANGSPVDVVSSTGALDEGGQDAFDTWGQLRLAVYAGSSLLTDTTRLNFGLAFSGPGHRWHTTTPATLGGVQVERQLLAPADQNWVRYVDTFHNTSGVARSLRVGWGGNLGSDGDTNVQASSSGDLFITAGDTWAVTQEGAPGEPAGDSPVGYAVRSPADSSYQGPVVFEGGGITTTWTGTGDDELGHLFSFNLAPGQTRRLAYFVYRGLAEDTQGSVDCQFYNNCVTPAVGAEVALADSTVAALVSQPVLCDLTFPERTSLVNWPGLALDCGDLFLPVLSR